MFERTTDLCDESGYPQNNWHFVEVVPPSNDGRSFTWRNKAGVEWDLYPNYDNNTITSFMVGDNCPYYTDGYTRAEVNYEDGQVVSIDGPYGERYIYKTDQM